MLKGIFGPVRERERERERARERENGGGDKGIAK